VLYTVWCLSKSYALKNIYKKQHVEKKEKEKVFASGRSCDRTTRSRFSVVFLGPRANTELVPKFHVSLQASHAALPMVTLKISLYTNVTLTLGWTTLFMGDMDEGAVHEEGKKQLSDKEKLQITDPPSHQRGHPT
jgi:hypothetical protein